MASPKQFLILDGIRGIAALFVMIRHTPNMWGFMPYRSYLAVDIFFVLSGFVIAHAYDRKLTDRQMSWQEFMVLRLIRLYPMYVLSVIACACIIFRYSTVAPERLPSEILTCFFTLIFVPVPLLPSTELFPINYVYWSLLFELLANGMYALLRPRISLWMNVGVFLSAFVVLVYVAQSWGDLNLGSDWGVAHIWGASARAIFGMFLGVVLYLLRTKLMLCLRLKGSYLLVMSIIALSLALPSVGRRDWVIDVILVSIVFPLCILSAAHGEVRRTAKLMSVLGAASYPVYLFHRPAARLVWIAIQDMEARYAPISGFVFAALLVTLAVIGEQVYDLPVRSWLKARFTPNPKIRAASM